MENKIIVIVSKDKGYGDRLGDYIQKQKTIPFLPYVFEDVRECKAFLKDKDVEIFLVEEKQREEFQESDGVVLYLTENRIIKKEASEAGIYKYQRVDKLLFQILQAYENSGRENMNWKCSIGEKRIVGIYSPVHRCGKTIFGLRYSKALSNTKKVLFLNLEPFSGLAGKLSKDTSLCLSDILFYIKERKETLYHYIETAVQKYENLSIMMPALVQADIGALTEEDWAWFFQQITEKSDYDVIVMELSDSMVDLSIGLMQCEALYVPSLRNLYATVKIDEFKQYLEKTGQTSVLEKMEILYLPKMQYESEKGGWSCVESEYRAYLENLMEKEEEKYA